MKPDDAEALLGRLAGLHADTAMQVLPDELLDAYREGRLDASTRQEIESLLVASSRARARLIEHAGLAEAAPPPTLRHRVLSHAPTRWTARRTTLSILGLAASLVLVTTALLVRPAGIPSDLRYDVTVRGLSPVRGEPSTPTAQAIALPSTTVRIEALPTTGASSAVDVGLYVRRGPRIERLDTGTAVATVRNRGAVSFAARASALVGEEPGERVLFVVVAATGNLPAVVTMRDGADPVRTLGSGGRRLVLPKRLTIVSERTQPTGVCP